MQSEELKGLEHLITTVVNLSPVQSAVLDVIDWDWSMRRIQELNGAPREAILSTEKMQALRRARQEQQARACPPHVRLPDGRERLVRHGYGPERQVQTGIGPVAVRRVQTHASWVFVAPPFVYKIKKKINIRRILQNFLKSLNKLGPLFFTWSFDEVKKLLNHRQSRFRTCFVSNSFH
jgi:hypothetical protein